MGGQGRSVRVRGGPDDAEIGEVWESGHFAGSGVEGRVRRTPSGWSVLLEAGPVGTIGRDGAASDAPLRLRGAEVVHGDRVLARVEDEAFAAGALALVWLGRRAWYAPPAASAPEAPAAPAPVRSGALALGLGVLLLVLAAGVLGLALT